MRHSISGGPKSVQQLPLRSACEQLPGGGRVKNQAAAATGDDPNLGQSNILDQLGMDFELGVPTAVDDTSLNPSLVSSSDQLMPDLAADLGGDLDLLQYLGGNALQ